MNFITIDFETANDKRYSACSLGMVIIENSQIIETKYWLIRPPEMYFDPFNVSLHGITEKDVYDKPEFNELWYTIKDYFENKIVFAHNANFDIYVLRDLLDYYEISHPKIKYACTVNLSQKIWDLNDYKLKTVASHLSYEFNHHDALEDAKVCAEIILRGCLETKTTTVEELLKKLKVRKKLFPEKEKYVHKISNRANNTQDDKYKKIENAGKSMQNIGCLLTIFITIPIILIVIFLVMCGRS